MAELNFNAKEVEPSSGFDPIPAGRYNVVITDSDYIETKKKNGHLLKLTFKVLDGQYANRMIWTNLNLDNPSEQAVAIAQSELSAICRACELDVIEDSQELHGIPLSAQVGIQHSEGYDPQNKISGFKPVTSGAEGGNEKAPW